MIKPGGYRGWMANGHGGSRPGAGGKPKAPAAVARALKLIESGTCTSPQDAAQHPEIKGKIGWRAIHNARERARRVQASARPADVPDELVVELPPPGLSTAAARRWYIEEQIKTLKRAIAQAIAMGERGISRLGTLSGQLRSWLDDLAKVSPDEPDGGEAARWKAAADRAVAKIEQGVRETEGAATCRRCGTACAACASAK